MKLREVLGDDILLFHDPVESYTFEEAVKIGRILGEVSLPVDRRAAAGLRYHGSEEAVRRPRSSGADP